MSFLCVLDTLGSFVDSLCVLCESLVSFIDSFNSLSVPVCPFYQKERNNAHKESKGSINDDKYSEGTHKESVNDLKVTKNTQKLTFSDP